MKSVVFGEINTYHNFGIDDYLEFKVKKKSMTIPLPLVKNYRLPVGKYKGHFKNDSNGLNIKVTFKVKEDKVVTVIPDKKQ